MKQRRREDGLFILMLSIHGLVRGSDIELGRDSDTGGQVTYVVELARALAADPAVDRVDLLTRRVSGRGIDPGYADPVEPLCPGARIIRIPCGPRRYLYKERLWSHLDEFVRHALCHLRMSERVPDVVHGHYADAGYVGALMAEELGVPFVFTGHSLGRVKLQRLLAKGSDPEALEQRFRFRRRFAAEELALRRADLVVASTTQEVERQYRSYRFADPARMRVIPPGVDLDRFHPPGPADPTPPIAGRIDRFLNRPRKPIVLALARPDERKNFRGLLHAFGGDPELREAANLVIVAGVRDKLGDLKPSERRILQEILQLIDDHDLYGRAAYPKHHDGSDVPDLYRLAASRRGVFVNPALTEPFGLTLIEAAACGLPVVATRDGGPRDILGQCRHGVLIDPLDPRDIARGIKSVLNDPGAWETYSASGMNRAKRLYSWEAHVGSYLKAIARVSARQKYRRFAPARPIDFGVGRARPGRLKARAAAAGSAIDLVHRAFTPRRPAGHRTSSCKQRKDIG